MRTATDAFVAPLEEWVRAIRADDFVAAKRHAEFICKAGELLAIRPEFVRSFQQHDNCDPKEALFHLCQFLVSAAEGRALAGGPRNPRPT